MTDQPVESSIDIKPDDRTDGDPRNNHVHPNDIGILAGSEETLESAISYEFQDDSCLGKTKRGFKRVYKAARSIFGLIFIFLLYSILGALLFMAIESRHEQDQKTSIRDERESVINNLLTISKPLSLDDNKWRNETYKLLLDYERRVREAIMNGVTSDSTEETWTIWSSLFFVFTVYTTIGYGNVAPATAFGRIVCIVYASIGIPLALLLLAELGKRFTVVLKYLWAYVRRYYYHGYCSKVRNTIKHRYQFTDEGETKDGKEDNKSTDSQDKSLQESRSRSGSRVLYGYEIDDQFNLPISVALGILFIYLLLGAIMYCLWEDWTFIEALYFVFISLSTIGFGDVLPAHRKFFIFSSIYMYIGLSLVSMCINVAIEFFNSAADRAKARMGEAKRKLGDRAKIARRNAKEKVADFKTNIKDETNKLRQKTDENFSTLKKNITDKTTNIMEKTDEKITGLKNNFSEETSKFRKRADNTFRRKAETPEQGTPPPTSTKTPIDRSTIEHPHHYEEIGNVSVHQPKSTATM